MLEIMGGVRSMMTYIGAVSLKEVPKRTTFIMVGAQLNNVFGQGVSGSATVDPAWPRGPLPDLVEGSRDNLSG